MTDRRIISWGDLEDAATALADRVAANGSGPSLIYGVPTGGSVVAAMLAPILGATLVDDLHYADPTTTLVVDDLVDTGATLEPYTARWNTDALFRKPHSPTELAPEAFPVDGWLVFPWEHDPAPTDAVTRLLEFVGEDPGREGLRETPRRLTTALEELTRGYGQDAATYLATTFEDDADEMIVVGPINFVSLCEHHVLPFTGTVTIGYVPTGRIVGLSKLGRVVDVFAHRLQIQERMTRQIADAIHDALDPLGVGVVVSAEHSCMAIRGVRKRGAVTKTSALLGLFREDAAARAEFLSLARNHDG